jgi:hypothetical protein
LCRMVGWWPGADWMRRFSRHRGRRCRYNSESVNLKNLQVSNSARNAINNS